VLLLAAILSVAACHRHRNISVLPKVDTELLNLSKEEAFGRGEKFFEEKKWTKARRYFSYVYENFPNDPLGRRSLLKVADTYFNQANPVNLVEAQYKYRDFINRYPGADSADYAMLQIAMVSFEQMDRPDRDQAKTKEAVDKLKDMLTAYPRSSLRPQAEEKLRQATDRLAKHEHIVARFYIKRGAWDSAISRLNGIVDQYPNYSNRDAMFYDLGVALERAGRRAEARLYYERVVAEFPTSDWAKKAKDKLQDSRS
jgi:outer membrane assembly lipoprotein YfiO